MAQKVSIELIDDLDGSKANSTVSFGIDGARYEIDLSDANAAKLRDVLAPYVAVARRADRGGTRRRTASSSEATVIRAWAKANGVKVSERGRVGAEVVAAYNAR